MRSSCTVTYSGPSYPQMHGTKCTRSAPHKGLRHLAYDAKGVPISWWTEEEKKALPEACNAG